MSFRFPTKLLIFWFLCFAMGSSQVASAQGSLSYPQPLAPGAEALGRGGTFVAKADSPLALEYNVAGLAQLRGTHVLVDTSLFFLTDNWSCQDWRLDKTRPCYSGIFAISTDFGILRRWTFTAGLRVPEYVTAYGRSANLPSSLDPTGALIPYRWPPALFLSPSLSVSVLAHPQLAIGLTLEDAVAVGLAACPPSSLTTPDAPACTGPAQKERSLFNPVLQLGLLGHLGSERATLMLGASVRSAPNLGQRRVFSSDPSVDLPWTVRAGLRVLHRSAGRSLADLELDGVAQIWTPVETMGLPARNSVGLRLGGSYGIPIKSVILIARAGFMFDWLLHSSKGNLEIAGFGQVAPLKSEEDRYQLSGTVGLGVEGRRFAVQLGYGYVSEEIRGTLPPMQRARQVMHLLSLSAQLRF